MATEAQDRARATWSAGDFDAIAQRIWGVGDDLVARVGVNEGERVLDVACGTGNAAIPAARRRRRGHRARHHPGAARGRAAQRRPTAGVEVEWVEGDAQDLPFEDGSFDVVVSTFGCMFAPDHKRAAGEIARVLAPGGRFGVAPGSPEGNIGQFFATIAKYAPPPPEGFQPPPLWGVRDHVNEIFDGTGDRAELRGRRRSTGTSTRSTRRSTSTGPSSARSSLLRSNARGGRLEGARERSDGCLRGGHLRRGRRRRASTATT